MRVCVCQIIDLKVTNIGYPSVIAHKYFKQNYDQIQEMFQIKHKGTISKIISKYNTQGNVDNNYDLCGNQGKIDIALDDLKDTLVDCESKKYSISNIRTSFNLKKYTDNLSRSSIYSLMVKLGIKYGRAQFTHTLTEQQLQQRKQFCKNYAYQDLSKIVYSDESIFSLKDSKLDIWYFSDFNRKLEQSEISYSQNQIHIWGGISLHGKTQIHIYNESVTSQQYQNCIKQSFIPFNQINQNRMILLQDGARPHTAKATEEFFRINNITVIQNPSYSPDLNSIELIWAFMKKIFNKTKTNKNITNKEQLINVVLDIWQNEISQQLIDQCINHTQETMKAIFENNGSY
ncbi:hypothetical protein ABPG72_019827 [Tetrahymena utriculariae]